MLTSPALCRPCAQMIGIGRLMQVCESFHQRYIHSSEVRAAELANSATTAAATAGPMPAQQQPSVYIQSRYQQYYYNILYREMLLKQNFKHFMEVPKIHKIELVVPTRTFARKTSAQKWEMLLPALGLEFVNAQTPVFDRLHDKHLGSTNVSSTRVTLTGTKAYAFLEKLSLFVLPNQVGFVGLSPESFDKHGNLTFRLGSMLNFADFEEVFDIFEDLKSMNITIVIKHAKNLHQAKLLLSGFGFPFQGNTDDPPKK